MRLEYAPQGLVGLLTPQANTTVEPEAWALLPQGFSLVNARMVSDAPSLNQRLLDYVWHVDKSLAQFANAPLSVAASKRVIIEQRDWPIDQMFDLQEPITGAILTSQDAREGAAAFAERRAPVWKGQ